MPMSDHRDHPNKWYTGRQMSNEYAIICCRKCSERLYCGRLPMPKSQIGPAILVDDIVGNLPHGWNSRTLDEIFNTQLIGVPYDIFLEDTAKLQQATEREGAADMPNPSGDGPTFEVVPDPIDTTSKEVHPSNNGSEQIEVTELGASYTVTAHFSRTVKDPSAPFGSITCGMDVAEVYPGSIDIESLRTLASDQFTALKAMVLSQLGLQFALDEQGMINEVFPDSQVVAQTTNAPAQQQAPQRPAQARSGPGGRSGAQRGQQASTGAQRGRRRQASPEPEALWYELTQNPGRWFWNQDKQNPRAADFLSLDHFQDDGWPVGLWETDRNGNNILPDDPDWRADYDDLSDQDFASQRPNRRQ